jgi:RNA recognition motif-containing protein
VIYFLFYSSAFIFTPSQTPPLHHLLIDSHSTDHVQQQQQHSTITTNMALTAEREAYLRLAEHSMANSSRFVPNFNIRSPKAYGGYVTSQTQATGYEQQRPSYLNGFPSSSNHAQSQALSDTNLYIKNLPPEYSDKDLAALVEGCGRIKSMKAIIDKQTNKCKGFGFIDFESHEDAQNAIAELQKKGYTAQLAKSSQQQEQDETNLYFANLDLNMTEQDLRQALSEYGNVVSVRILRDQQKQSRGVGFARMNDKKQCQEIIDQFHNKTFPNFTDKPVQVKFADASKNKKLYKSGLDDMKSGPPLYSPMEQTGSYPPQAVLYPTWTQISPQQVPVHTQPAPPHAMYGQAAPLRPTLPGFNHPIPSYMQSTAENGAAFVVPLPVQQLQQLQIANGHPGAYCVVNPQHPAFFMQPGQPQSQPQHDQ